MQTCVAFLTGKQCFSDKLSIECDVCVRDILVENLVPPAETQIIQVTIAFKIKKTCANFLYWLFFGFVQVMPNDCVTKLLYGIMLQIRDSKKIKCASCGAGEGMGACCCSEVID
jgi:hypothetical protein